MPASSDILMRFVGRVHRRLVVVRALERGGACVGVASVFACLFATIALFQNADVLAVLSRSTRNREVFREGALVLWAADGQDGERYAAAFNLGSVPMDAVLDAGNIGFPASGVAIALWTGR